MLAERVVVESLFQDYFLPRALCYLFEVSSVWINLMKLKYFRSI